MASFQEPSASGGNEDGQGGRGAAMLRGFAEGYASGFHRNVPAHADGGHDGGHPEVTSAVETRVVPWIVLAHRGAAAPLRAESAGSAPTREDIVLMADAARRNDLARVVALVDRLCAAGAALDQLYLDLVSPAAALLGQMWHDDTASIAEVTVGLACLQRLVHAFGPAFHQDDLRPDPRRRILLAPLPGEQHSFALVLVAEFLRRAGWDADNGRVLSCAALCDVLRREWFALAGLSVSCTTRLDIIAATIHALRQASRNRGIGILVGGPLFTNHPEFVAQVGADAMATDARHAVVQADSLVGLLAGRA
jgi:methanogenic corrinoid protein MtbC1